MDINDSNLRWVKSYHNFNFDLSTISLEMKNVSFARLLPFFYATVRDIKYFLEIGSQIVLLAVKS